MMKLTCEHGKTIFVNPSRVEAVAALEDSGSSLHVADGEGGAYGVKESPEEVAVEFRAAMRDELTFDERVNKMRCGWAIRAAARAQERARTK